MESRIDWLTLTMVPENKAVPSEENYASAIKVLTETLLLDELFTMLGYKGSARYYGIRLEYNDVNIKLAMPEDFNKQGLSIELSSNGLDYFNEYLSTYGLTMRLWCARFRRLCCEGWVVKCTRYDYAMDDIRRNDERPCLTMKRVLTSICDEEIVCKARTFSDNGKDFASFQRNYKRRGGKGLWGTTVTLGQRKAGTVTRFYDKLIEQKQKNKQVDEDITSWVRCEVEYHDCDAMGAFNAWIDLPDNELKLYMCGRANDTVRFIYRTSSNISRCPVKRWWKEFLNGCTSRFQQHTQKPVRTALARAERGLRQNARNNYTFLREYGLEAFGKLICAIAAEVDMKGKSPINHELVNNLCEGARHREEMDGFKWFDYTTDVSSKSLRGMMAQDYYTYNQHMEYLKQSREDGRQYTFDELADVWRGCKVVEYGV